MTAHDPRVTLTEAEKQVLRLAHWPVEPPSSDNQHAAHYRMEAAAEQIVTARLAPIRALADEVKRRAVEEWNLHSECADLGDEHRADQAGAAAEVLDEVSRALRAALDALDAHDGAEGQGEGVCWCDGPDCGQTPCIEER